MTVQMLYYAPRPLNDNVGAKLSLHERLFYLGKIAGKIKSYKFTAETERKDALRGMEIELANISTEMTRELKGRLKKAQYIKDIILKEKMKHGE